MLRRISRRLFKLLACTLPWCMIIHLAAYWIGVYMGGPQFPIVLYDLFMIPLLIYLTRAWWMDAG